MARKKREHVVNSEVDLIALDAEIDCSVCGVSLADWDETRFSAQGAHDPDPTHYFVLEELFAHYSFTERSHLLDVGCGTGRVLAHFLRQGYAGHATGIELDPDLATVAQEWTSAYEQVEVLHGNVLDLDLSSYTDFYLFNPFDQHILQQFIETLEGQAAHPCTYIHMSDNGDTWRYVGRPGWTELASGSFLTYTNSRGRKVKVYDNAQHYTVWRYDPHA